MEQALLPIQNNTFKKCSDFRENVNTSLTLSHFCCYYTSLRKLRTTRKNARLHLARELLDDAYIYALQGCTLCAAYFQQNHQ